MSKYKCPKCGWELLRIEIITVVLLLITNINLSIVLFLDVKRNGGMG